MAQLRFSTSWSEFRETTEARWEKSSQEYSREREQLELLLKEDPTGNLTSAYEQLKELSQEADAPDLVLPEPFQPEFLNGTPLPDQTWHAAQADRKERTAQLRLLIRDPQQAPPGHPLRVAFEEGQQASRQLEMHSGQLNQSVGSLIVGGILLASLLPIYAVISDGI